MLKHFWLIGSLIAALFISPVLAAPPPGINFVSGKMDGVPVNIVEAPLGNSGLEVKPALAARGLGRSESFGSFVKRHQPLAAITGTFFCNRSLLPVGDVVLNGRVLYRGNMGTALAVRDDGGVDFIKVPRNTKVSWKGYRQVLSCGPTLVWDGEIDLSPREEGFRDPHIFSRRPRSAVGIKADNTLLAVVVRRGVSLHELATIMQRLGCKYAINLDGGGSVALSVGRKIVYQPSRSLTNVLMVTRKNAGVQQVAMSNGGPRGLDWRYGNYRGVTVQAESFVSSGSAVLRTSKGRLALSPSKMDPGMMDITAEKLAAGWGVEFRSDGRTRGFITPPCTVPIAQFLPEGHTVQAILVDPSGRYITSIMIQAVRQSTGEVRLITISRS